jgi:hypothetical protein
MWSCPSSLVPSVAGCDGLDVPHAASHAAAPAAAAVAMKPRRVRGRFLKSLLSVSSSDNARSFNCPEPAMTVSPFGSLRMSMATSFLKSISPKTVTAISTDLLERRRSERQMLALSSLAHTRCSVPVRAESNLLRIARSPSSALRAQMHVIRNPGLQQKPLLPGQH